MFPTRPLYRWSLLAAATVVGLAAGVRALAPVPWLMGYLLAVNFAAGVFYWVDKRAAAAGSAGRVPERVLHGLALAGGSPAALVMQRWLRHKTWKREFQVVYWSIVGVQVVGVLGYLLVF